MSEISALEGKISSTIIDMMGWFFTEKQGDGQKFKRFYERVYMKPLLQYVQNGEAKKIMPTVMKMIGAYVNSLMEVETAYTAYLSEYPGLINEVGINTKLKETRLKIEEIAKVMKTPEDILMAEMEKAREPIQEIFRCYKPVSVRRSKIYSYR